MDGQDPFIGTVGIAGFNFAPRGWATCDGQLLPISQNTALFSLLGTQYGGNGTSTFALPDLRGRVPLNAGQGPGLTPYVVGETDGAEAVTLLTAQIPAHTHQQTAYGLADSPTPAGAVLAPAPSRAFRPDGGTFSFATLAPTGGGKPHENRQPYTVLNYCIALQGVYPSFP
ncbi:phage tail protein [Nocardioides rubriscoriae]|uniref:phage tail protein n=1 Tax=Nocardioides rubriscoriae TaxID=642762 RepID=UPI0011DF01D7|nr:tail fiber protein [Nocardioides rubriscoriae]